MNGTFLIADLLLVLLAYPFMRFLHRLGFFSFPEYRKLRRSDRYHEAMQFAELSTVVFAGTAIGYGALFLGAAYLLGAPLPSVFALAVFVSPWAVVGALISLVMARRVWRTPGLYAEPQELLVEMVEDGSLDSFSVKPTKAHWKFLKLNLRYAFVTHKRDLLAWLFILSTLFLLYGLGGAGLFFSALVAAALGIHASWYGWKRWYLLPRIRRVLESNQVVFRVTHEVLEQ